MRRRNESKREALRSLVTRLNSAALGRENARRGTREFREADEATRRYRRILLDDELFQRYVRGEVEDQGPVSQRPRNGP